MLESRFAALLLMSLVGCGLGPANDVDVDLPGAGGQVRVLFIGNSLTYWNDLPGVVEALAESVSTGAIRVGSVTAPDFHLGDHWEAGSALEAIDNGGWNVVVLQQGPSSLEVNRAQLIADTRRFAVRIRAVGARPALYQVWPSTARQGDWDRALESYRLAADTVQGLLLPAGAAWRIALDSGVALYESDGLHPAPAGTYLAALVMVQRLLDRSPVGLPAGVRTRSGVTLVVGASAATLQAAAAQATGVLTSP